MTLNQAYQGWGFRGPRDLGSQATGAETGISRNIAYSAVRHSSGACTSRRLSLTSSPTAAQWDWRQLLPGVLIGHSFPQVTCSRTTCSLCTCRSVDLPPPPPASRLCRCGRRRLTRELQRKAAGTYLSHERLTEPHE